MTNTSAAVQLALLRAVNVGGHGKVSMAELRRTLERRGFADVRTLLQTGNVILRASPGDGRTLQRRLETELEADLGLKTDVFVRSATELAEVIAQNPFPDQAADDPSHLLVVFSNNPPSAAALADLRSSITGRERVHAVGRHLYITYPDGIGRSRLRSEPRNADRGARGTARNWNTILMLAAAMNSPI
jgi:uncharacterized protein (DUF1697 family)